MQKYIFVVCNSLQLENASAVAVHIKGQCNFFDLWTGSYVGQNHVFPGHTPPVDIGRCLQIIRSSSLIASAMVVLPQDVGLLQQVTAICARRRNSKVALMPDGVMSTTANKNGSQPRLALRRFLFKTIGRLFGGYSSPGTWGNSSPDLVLSWGAGWDIALPRVPLTRIVHTGCPRMDSLASIDPVEQTGSVGNILICSQPLFVPAWSAPYAAAWYSFLTSVVQSDAYKDGRIRIRLHPTEHESPDLPLQLRESAQSVNPLSMDLEWAGQVLSPFSTVLFDALASGRLVGLLIPDESFNHSISSVPPFADSDFPRISWNLGDILSASNSALQTKVIQNRYLVNCGDAASKVAKILASA